MASPKGQSYLIQMLLSPAGTQDHLVCKCCVPVCPYPNGRHQVEANTGQQNFCHYQIHLLALLCRGWKEAMDFSEEKRRFILLRELCIFTFICIIDRHYKSTTIIFPLALFIAALLVLTLVNKLMTALTVVNKHSLHTFV